MSYKLLISCPPGYEEERQYIFEVLLKEFLDLDYEIQKTARAEIKLYLKGSPEVGSLSWPDIFFQKAHSRWLNPASLPEEPLPVWDVTQDLQEANVLESTIPVIFGEPLENGAWFDCKGKDVYLGIDVAGSIFFMLTRYEELVLSSRDEYGRFPAKASLAYREGFLERPIVDEYVEIFWAAMKRIWPGLQRKQRGYQVFLSHDVDHPLIATGQPWRSVLRGAAGDIIKRKDLRMAWQRFIARCSGSSHVDPANSFDFIIAESERHGFKSAFYFKAGCSNSRFDEDYSLDMPWILELLRHIHERGHEIGLHLSYETYKDLNRSRSEFTKLLQVAEQLKITQGKWGGRQHYLRWECPTTWQIYEEIGLDYDTSLAFADHVGFRCGTCHEFPVFNLKTRKTLHLRERTLIVMEGTLLNRNYMAAKPDEALDRIEHLSKICRRYEGNLTLLWHNTSLMQSWQKKLYSDILRCLK